MIILLLTLDHASPETVAVTRGVLIHDIVDSTPFDLWPAHQLFQYPYFVVLFCTWANYLEQCLKTLKHVFFSIRITAQSDEMSHMKLRGRR
jgi:hypothetical protein